MSDNEAIRLKLLEEERVWEDLPKELLHEILSRIFAGDRVMFRSVCKLWNSVTLFPSKQHLGPLTKPDCFHPYLIFANDSIFHPIHGDLYCLKFRDMPITAVRAAKDDWLLMDDSVDLFFFNSFTEAKVKLPPIGYICALCFSSPPTSKDWLVVAATSHMDYEAIYSIRAGDENWTWEHSLHFNFSFYNSVFYKGMYYFLGTDANLLIYNPNEKRHDIYEPPEPVSRLISPGGMQYKFEREVYMLESDEELWLVFVGYSGSPVYVFQWNLSMKNWETVESLGNKMLFVSRPLSLTVNATVNGTSNKIYFPRLVGKHNLFYSLSTKKYHTFEMDTSCQGFEGFEGSMLPLCAIWIRP